MRAIFILVFSVSTGVLGEISITHAMKLVGEAHQFSPAAIANFLWRALRIGWLWFGVGLMTLSFYALLTMLSWYPVSFVVPATSLGYVMGAFGAKFLLGEQLSPTRWAGVGLICLGVALAWVNRAPQLPSALALRLLARDAVFVCAAIPLIFYLLGAWAAWRFFRSSHRGPAPTAGDFAPPVSILKPVLGLERGAYESFASHCQLDYPEYEILFAAQEDDPIVPVIQQLMRDFPDRPGRSIRLLFSERRTHTPDKVIKLCLLAREARYGVLVLSDSDVYVSPDYLRVVVAPFADPRVGGVTSLYRASDPPSSDVEPPTFGAIMHAVGSSGAYMANVLVEEVLEGVKFALGPTMATRREVLQQMGGFESLLDVHADDYEFGKRIAEMGYRMDLVSGPLSILFESESLPIHMRHELRWIVSIRHIRPGGHFGMLFTHGLAWALAAALLSPTKELAAAWLGAYLVVRLFSAYVVGVWGLKDRVLRRWIWLLPLYDFTFTCYWLVSFFVNHIEWRGLLFKIERGRMIPLTPRPDRS